MNPELNRRSLMRWVGAGGASLALAGAVPASAQTASSSAFFNLREFGAKGDGQTLDTRAIQAAIQACADAGGGTLVVPAGNYLTGTITLKSQVALWLQPGAVLLGSTDLKDYPPIVPAYRSYTDVNYVERSLIYAEKVHDVAIFGQGVIDGQGGAKAFQLPGGREHYKQRPYLIRMIECARVVLRDVTLRNSAMWVQHYLACEDVVIDGITVHSLVNANNDGLDIDGCQRMRVSNCSITSGDDAIVLKSTGPRPCRAITISNCYLSSRCSAFKCGTESSGGFFDIAFSNSVIDETRLCAIALEAVDGGTLDGVVINNIRIRKAGGAIFMRRGNRARPYLAEGPGGKQGTHVVGPGQVIPEVAGFRNVHISQVTGEGFDLTGCALCGIPGHPLEQIVLDGIHLTFPGGGTAADAQRDVPEMETAYPEYKMFGRLPAFGFFCRHAKDLRLSDIRLALASLDGRPELVCEDVEHLEVRGWDALSAPSQGPEIVLKDVREAWVHGCRAASGAPVFTQVRGAQTRSVRFSGNWCRPPVQLVETDADIPAQAVQNDG